MPEALWLLAAAVAIAGTLWWRRAALARTARHRLADGSAAVEVEPVAATGSRPGPSTWLVAAGLGVVVALTLAVATSVDRGLATALGFVTACLAASLGSSWRANRRLRIDGQLADALDLVVAALRSGTTVIEALDSAAAELGPPVSERIAEAAGRLRLGEDTADVMADLEADLEVETARLFAQALIVQSRTGSALVPALASVARAARDRIELARRVRAQTSEVRFSVIAVIAVTYGIAWLSWSTAPERVTSFLASGLGGGLVALCVALQGVGILWLDRLSRIDV